MNRIDRLSAILVQLQSKRVVKAQEIADRFNISLRTVYRDVKALDEAGVPVIGEAGMGYSIMEGYRLPPIMFTREEATAFLTAEKLVEKLTDVSTKNQYTSAMLKVKAVLRHAEKDYLQNMEQHIEVVENPYLPNRSSETAHLQNILQCISNKTVLQMDYFANHNHQHSSRKVEPVGIYFQGEHWYMVAFCQLRNDYRTFKCSSIKKLAITEIQFHQQHPSLKSFLNKVTKERELKKVVLLVDKSVLPFLGNQKYYSGFVSEKDTGAQMEMTFLTGSLKGFVRFFLMFGDYADIVHPKELKTLLHEVMDAVGKRNQ
ncbi:MAG: YafY family transcriptional regulator [Bacteroidetes bacterium]|nr:YafY family transcriptional regulator [Bacteroidota bacterium]